MDFLKIAANVGADSVLAKPFTTGDRWTPSAPACGAESGALRPRFVPCLGPATKPGYPPEQRPKGGAGWVYPVAEAAAIRNAAAESGAVC